MKQKTLIIAGVLLVIILLATWIYLLSGGKFNSPTSVWNNLGVAGEEDNTIVIAPEPEIVEGPVVNLDRPKLRQLTTKQVIGFSETRLSTTSPLMVTYVEGGTGHVFQIDLSSGNETRISNTTFPEASLASLSADGLHLAIRSENNRRANSLIVGEFSTSTSALTTFTLDKLIYDFTISNTQRLFYTTKESSGTLLHSLDLKNKADTSLLTIPFFEAAWDWSKVDNNDISFYPKPSYLLAGYLYSLTKGRLKRVPISGLGLVAFSTASSTIYTKKTNYVSNSHIYLSDSDTHQDAPIIMLPEKCVGSSLQSNIIWCGNELSVLPLEFPDDWYRGKMSFKDSIWEVRLDTRSASPLVDTLIESGREIDITDMSIGESETALYFINKNDNTLWMYEL